MSRPLAERPKSARAAPAVEPIAPLHGPTDAELVERARGGDRWATEAIFRRHVPAILGVATRLLGHTGEADDVVQDTFAAAFARLDRLEDADRLRSWLLGIAVHRAQRRLRSRRFMSYLGLAEDVPALTALAAPDASPEVRAELARVEHALSRVSIAERVAWQLRRVEGHKLEEIAALTGASLATVKRRIEAVERLLARWAKEDR